MGTWGSANFDSDNAREFLDSIVEQLSSVIREGMTPESLGKYDFLMSIGESKVLPAIDILVNLCNLYRTTPEFDRKEVDDWRKTYLQIYDNKIDAHAPQEEYKLQRRMVILETFNNFEKLVIEWEAF